MSKKSFKKLQNRLYREIKRRIQAEAAARFPVPVVRVESKVDTLKIRRLVQAQEPLFNKGYTDYIRSEMARQMADSLLKEGYIEFRSGERDGLFDCIEVEARLKVVR
jgi:tRNA isopentenyl-2-thiomethyl-A-37 hydroxylase MiaE